MTTLGNPKNSNMVPNTSRMYDRDGNLKFIDDVVNDYVSVPMTASNNDAAITLHQAGIAGKSWYISYANWRVSGGNVGNIADVAIKIMDGATTIYQSVIAKNASNGASLSTDFSAPIKIATGHDVTVTVDRSGNTGTIITFNLGLFNK